MPHPRRFLPRGLSDAIDGTDAPAGASALLQNLIPEPNGKVLVPRPGVALAAWIPNWATAVTALEDVGNEVYGMAGTTAFPNRDAPFIYNTATGTFTTILGLTSASLPISPSTSGDWTPPTIVQVGSRVIFTHPGFAGGNTFAPVNIQFAANAASGSPTLIGPDYLYLQTTVGLSVIDMLSRIPANTQVSAVAPVVIYTTGAGTAGGTTITLGSATGVFVGQSIFFPGGQSIITGLAGVTATVPNALPQNFSGASVAIQGTTLTLTKNATSTGSTTVSLLAPSPALKFGWLDLSSFSTTIVADSNNNSVLAGSFSLAGIAPGMTVTGPGIVGGTTVVGLANLNFGIAGQTTSGSQILQLAAYPTGSTPAAGEVISGPNIPASTFVISYNPATFQLTMSNAATGTASQQNYAISGALIQLSQVVSANFTQAAFTIAGGTPAAPLWGSGDLAINSLPAVPVCVNAMFNRAYFFVNTATTAGAQASDAGSPCVQTFISQTLTFTDPTPVTAATQLQLATLTGGGAQALVVFQQDTGMVQITGDFSNNSISVNALTNPAGTLAPNTIATTPRGVLFMASDGLRLLNFNANVSDPIGQFGQGLTVPMANVVTPSRASASYNENVYRLTVTWQPPPSSVPVWGLAQRTDEFWFHLAELGQPLERSFWSGPHSSTAVLSQPFGKAASFLIVPTASPSMLYQSDVRPTSTSSYVEAGAPIACVLQTLLTPDNHEQHAIEVIETTIWIRYLSRDGEILVTATDDVGQVLDQAYVWLGPFSVAAQRQVPWHNKLIFRQMALTIAATATPYLEIGAINVREESLGYQLPYPVALEFVLNQSILGGPDDLGP